MRLRWGHWLGLAALSVAGLCVAVFLLIETGIVQRWVRQIVVSQIEQHTGARVELGGFHLHIWQLRAELDDLTLHGLEAAGTPPLFHAAHVNVAIRILSLTGKEIAIDELVFDQPQVAVRVDKNGKSNVPTPRVAGSKRPWRETLFSLRIGHLELRGGSVTFNDREEPLGMLGENLQFQLRLDGASSPGTESYVGNLQWKQIELAARRDLPFRFDISAKFTLHPNSFELDDLALKLPHSDLNLRAELPSFAQSDWNLHYRGRLTLADVRTIFRSPLTPDGIADFSGQARYASGQWTANGHYQGHDFLMTYKWFHAGGMETWGDYEMAKNRLVVQKINIRALGGTITGHLQMDTETLAFKTETQVRGVSLRTAFAAVQNPSFPVVPLHWDAKVDIDSVNTWTANFQHFRSKGECLWSPPETLEAGLIPLTARIEYDTSEDSRGVSFGASEISTPKTDIQMDGYLAAKASALNLNLRTDDVYGWDDFINVIRGADSTPSRIAGALTFRGKIEGPLGGPTFSGHLQATDARFDNFYFDYLGGDLEYSPDDFRLTKTTVRRGQASADVDVFLELDGGWGFSPASQWTFDAKLAHTPTSDVQNVFGLNYPVKGILSGTFHGGGTRIAPLFDANFALDDVDAKGIHLDRFAGLLHVTHDLYQITNGEVRSGQGLVTGNILYRPVEQETEFNLTGASIPLEKIAALQTQSIPVSGRLDFDIRGSGPIRSPAAEGNVRLVGLQVGADLQGNFRGRIKSDGENARISLVSEINAGRLQGEFSIGLHGDNQVAGELTVKQFQMDAFIMSGLHLKQLTGHSSVDGKFTLSGSLRHPETIEMNANIDEISFNYDLVELKNDGPIRLTYRRNEVRIDQARLHGPNTDLQFSGSARFDRDRPLHLSLAGSLNLRFLDRMIPELFALGRADVNVSVEGTMSRPRITGRASLKDASATYSDFPMGLSHVSGDLVFDRSRMLFDRDFGAGWRRPIATQWGCELWRRTAALRIECVYHGGSHPLSGRHELACEWSAAAFRLEHRCDIVRKNSDSAPAVGGGRGFRGSVHHRFRNERHSGVQLDADAQSHVRHRRPNNARRAHPVDRRATRGRRQCAVARYLGSSRAARPYPFAWRRNGVSRQQLHAYARRRQFRESVSPRSGAEHRSNFHNWTVSGDDQFFWRSEPSYAQLSFRSAVTGFGHHRAARDRQPRAGERIAVIHFKLSKLWRYGPAFRGNFERAGRANRKAFWYQPFSRRSVPGGYGDGIKCCRARHDSAAVFAEFDGDLLDERCYDEPVSADPGGICDPARHFRDFLARYQRYLRV